MTVNWKKRQIKIEQRINSGVKIHVLQIIAGGGGYNYRIKGQSF